MGCGEGLVSAVKLPSGWLIPTALKAAVLMCKTVVEGEGRIRP
ncbi:MAG: hypothetical protein QW680_08920 [Pyrobaculum sp.]